MCISHEKFRLIEILERLALGDSLGDGKARLMPVGKGLRP